MTGRGALHAKGQSLEPLSDRERVRSRRLADRRSGGLLEIMPAEPALADQESGRRLEDVDQGCLGRLERRECVRKTRGLRACGTGRRPTIRRSSVRGHPPRESTPIAPKSTRPVRRSPSKRKCSGRASRRQGWRGTSDLDPRRAVSKSDGATDRASASQDLAAPGHLRKPAAEERKRPRSCRNRRAGDGRWFQDAAERPGETLMQDSPAHRWWSAESPLKAAWRRLDGGGRAGSASPGSHGVISQNVPRNSWSD